MGLGQAQRRASETKESQSRTDSRGFQPLWPLHVCSTAHNGIRAILGESITVRRYVYQLG